MGTASKEELRKVYQKEDTGEKTFIPAKPKADLYGTGHIYRVCAYCRVSTDNDEQLSSFELQQAHYKQLAHDHPNWRLKEIYADEGISGTSLKNRAAFNEMIEACRRGEYDLIVTKSVSRFARNLVDCISLIRMLKNLQPPVGVFFETDNLYTLSENTEFMLSFLATFAQEESVKKSEAMNWSLKQRFKDGKLLTPAPLGYDRPKDVTGRYIKYLTCKLFAAKVFDLMGWDPQYRYKMMGNPAVYEGEMLYLFKLTDFELFVSGRRSKSYLPESWRDYFGTPVEQHEESYKIDLADGYISTERT